MSNPDLQPRDARANTTAWSSLAIACAVMLVAAVVALLAFGIPGFTGGTSPSQQQTSGAPQPANEIRDGSTRQNTTGYGDKTNQ